MDYRAYQDSRDLAWQILIDCNVVSLPVKITNICKHFEIGIMSFENGYNMLKNLNLEKMVSGKDGFTLAHNSNFIIFYNQACSNARCRFTIAHELGHILLGHIKAMPNQYIYTTINREPHPKDNPLEQQANVFASRILAPICVLWGMNVKSKEKIARICDISIMSAEFRLQRLQELYKKEKHFLETSGKSCFLQSALERKVYKQFLRYIQGGL